MADFRKLGVGLQGMGAWFSGQGPQWEQQQYLQREREKQMAMYRQEQAGAARGDRSVNAALAIRAVGEQLDAGNVDRAVTILNESMLGSMGTPVQNVASPLKQLIAGGRIDDAKNAIKLLDQEFTTRLGLPSRSAGEVVKPSDIGPGGVLTTRNESGHINTQRVPGYENHPGSQPEHNRASAISRAYDNGTTLKVLPDGTTEVTDPSGRVVEGDERLAVLRTAREEQIEFARNRAEATGFGAGSSERVNLTITEGLDAASSAATLRRGMELLESVKTGGINAVASRARQLFGVEGADEGELSANLGQAVLSQLKPIFGSAFTEREGARLERISAGLGRNPETNIRLLAQLLSVVERDANRAIDAAISIRDFRTADEIQELLNFKLTDEGGVTEGAVDDNLTEEERRELQELREWANGRR